MKFIMVAGAYLKVSLDFFVIFLLLGVNSLARAGNPMNVDDAGIVDKGTCQIEIWSELSRSSDEYWVAPACNLGGNLELSLGAGLQDESGAATGKNLTVQAKTLVVEDLAQHLNIAIAVGYFYNHFDGGNLNEWSINLPVTKGLGSESLLWHNNLGTIYEQEDKHWLFTWGTGLEYELNATFSLYAEIFGESGARPLYQLAAGYWLLPEQVQLTFGFADVFQTGEEQHRITLGLNWVGITF